MKTAFWIIVCALIAVVLAWVGLVLWHPKDSVDQGTGLLLAALVIGGAGGALWRWTSGRRRHSGD